MEPRDVRRFHGKAAVTGKWSVGGVTSSRDLFIEARATGQLHRARGPL